MTTITRLLVLYLSLLPIAMACNKAENEPCKIDFQCGTGFVCDRGVCVLDQRPPMTDATVPTDALSDAVPSNDAVPDAEMRTCTDPVTQMGNCLSSEKCTVPTTLDRFVCGPRGTQGRDQSCATDSMCAASTICAQILSSPARCVQVCNTANGDMDCAGPSPPSLCLLQIGTIVSACTTPCTQRSDCAAAEDCKVLSVAGVWTKACLPSGTTTAGMICSIAIECVVGTSCIGGGCARTCTGNRCNPGETCNTNGLCVPAPADGGVPVEIPASTERRMIQFPTVVCSERSPCPD